MKGTKLLGFILITLPNLIVTSPTTVNSSPSLFQPLFGSSNITTTFWDCSNQCHADPTCIGITIYQEEKDSSSNNNSNNDTIPTNVTHAPVPDFFWCKLSLADSDEDLARGQIVYKIMFRQKLQHVERIPPKKKNRNKRQAEIDIVKNTPTISTPSSDTNTNNSQVTIQNRVINLVPLLPPQKTTIVQIPNLTRTEERVTVLPGELDSQFTIATTPIVPTEQILTTTTISPVPFITEPKPELVIEKGKVEVTDSNGKNISVVTNTSLPTVSVTTPNKNVTIANGLTSSSVQLEGAEIGSDSLRINDKAPQLTTESSLEYSSPVLSAGDNKIVIDLMVPSTQQQQQTKQNEKELIRFPESSDTNVVVQGSPQLSLLISQSNKTVEPESHNHTDKISENQSVSQKISESQHSQVVKVQELLSHTITSMTDLLQMLSHSLDTLDQTCSSVQTNPVMIMSTATTTEMNKVPDPSEQLEGEGIDKLEPTNIPTVSVQDEEQLVVTAAPFPILRPSNIQTVGPVQEQEVVLDVEHNVNPECIFSDRERFKRNILATTFSLLYGEPTMLTFVNGSSCLGTFSKTGIRRVRSIAKIFPDFPSQLQIMAGAFFLQNSVYLFDSAQQQAVWNFSYDDRLGVYRKREGEASTMTKDFFLITKCGMREEDVRDIYVKAIAQVSQADPSCIVFDHLGTVHLSPNASEDAIDLSRAISFMTKTEFVDRVESVFVWLDESIVNFVYVFGSNGEVYQLYRDSSTQFKWQNGAYRIIPYEDFPY